jgi:L-fuconolactonase
VIIDAQVHAWAPDGPEYPWDREFCGQVPADILARFRNDGVPAEQVVEWMDRAGVDAALLTSSRIYGSDHRYAFAAAERHPGRFAVVGPAVPGSPDVDEVVARIHEHPHGIGVRLIVYPADPDLSSALYGPVYAAAERLGVPLFLTPVQRLRSVPDLVRAHPSLVVVLDHLGLTSPDEPGPERLRMLPDLLRLAEFDTVAVKCTGAPELSRREYPFDDLWPSLRRVVDAFGAGRVLWGTDFTQHRDELTYEQALDYLRLTSELADDEKELILGGAAQRLLGWPPV